MLSMWYWVIWLMGFVFGAPGESSIRDFGACWPGVYIPAADLAIFFPSPIPSVVDFFLFLIFQVVGMVQFHDSEASSSAQDWSFCCLY